MSGIAYRYNKPMSVMVWAGLTGTFIEQGVTINQYVDLKMLKTQLVPCINSTSKEFSITPPEDGTTPHSANLVQQWCRKNMVGF